MSTSILLSCLLTRSCSGTEPEESIADAVSALIYAAPRTEIKELQLLRELLMQKVSQLTINHA